MSDELANALYCAVVQPEMIWWDDLTPEIQDGWRRGVAEVERVREAAAFMLDLVDVYYGTDHEFDIEDEEEFRRHRGVIETGGKHSGSCSRWFAFDSTTGEAICDCGLASERNAQNAAAVSRRGAADKLGEAIG